MKSGLLLSIYAGLAAGRAVTGRAPADNGTAQVEYLGRINPATNELSWPGTGVRFTFEGTGASIGLASTTGDNSADLIVDGGAPTVISNVSGTSIDTPAGLAQGTHTVELRKRSETSYGSIFLSSGASAVTVSSGGTLCAGPAPPTRQIEVIGDSITVGYGLDGVGPCSNSAAVEDNPKTYAALAANALGADYNIVAWSGKGIVRNYVMNGTDTSPIMPELWTRYGANDADNSYPFPSSWSPDAVVINLGTNDFGYVLYNSSGQPYDARPPLDPSVYGNATVNFTQTVLGKYPNAQVFLMTSPMLSDTFPTSQDMQKTTQTNALQAAVNALGAKAHLVNWPTQGSATGCDSHPNADTHAAEATVLASAISSALGW